MNNNLFNLNDKVDIDDINYGTSETFFIFYLIISLNSRVLHDLM
jgi:hypothetical protein